MSDDEIANPDDIVKLGAHFIGDRGEIVSKEVHIVRRNLVHHMETPYTKVSELYKRIVEKGDYIKIIDLLPRNN